LKGAGYQVYAVNPNAEQVEGDACYPDLHSVPEPVEAVMIVTHPDMAAKVVRECADLGIRHVWLHRSFGQGSVSEEAIAECERHNVAAGIIPPPVANIVGNTNASICVVFSIMFALLLFDSPMRVMD